MKRKAIGTSMLVIVLLAAACGPSRDIRGNPFQPRSERDLTIVVENRNFNDATLHAVSMGDRVRLGIVGGQSTETYQIRWTALKDLHFEISLLAGGSHTTRSITARPGDRVGLRIESNLGQSTVRPSME
jgi:hypothetical protein